MTDDLAAIEALHAADEAASRAGDFATLRSLLTEDVVVLAPGALPVHGRPPPREGAGGVEDYRFAFEEVTIRGDLAFEWGAIHGAVRTAEGVKRLAYNVMRILRKDSDGAWRVHRTIWNERPVDAD